VQVVDALEVAHGKQIIHRKLKPANVKLRPDGTVKVLDFGIAKVLHTGIGISGRAASRSINEPTSGPSAACSTKC
jgi:serine/threonine protein kinase